jgi:hypothetical protein
MVRSGLSILPPGPRSFFDCAATDKADKNERMIKSGLIDIILVWSGKINKFDELVVDCRLRGPAVLQL